MFRLSFLTFVYFFTLYLQMSNETICVFCVLKTKTCLHCFILGDGGGFLTALKFRSNTTRTLLSMLVRFFLRLPGRPSRPSMGVEREEGLGSMLSTAMVSVPQRPRKQMKTHSTETVTSGERFTMWLKMGNRNFFSVIKI